MKNFFLISFLFCFLGLMAQTGQNVVVLKNGSQIRGSIIEQVPGESIKIKTSDGSIFVYNMSEVERVAMSETSTEVVSEYSSLTMYGHKGIDFSLNVGPVFGFNGGSENSSFMADFEIGKKFNQSFYFGLGGGINLNKDISFFPVFLSSTLFIPSGSHRVIPSINLRAGCMSEDFEDNYMGMCVLTPGIQVPITKCIDLNAGVGYVVTFAEGSTAHSMTVRIGIGFHGSKKTRK